MIPDISGRELQFALLALSPFFLVTTSLSIGVYVGLLSFAVLIFMSLLLVPLRNLIPVQQRLVTVIILSSAIFLIVHMLLNAGFYDVADKIGLFLPLIMINALMLSVYERVFSEKDLVSLFSYVLGIGTSILLFFVTVGFSRDLFDQFSFINSSAACFILTGFLFAAMSLFNPEKLKT